MNDRLPLRSQVPKVRRHGRFLYVVFLTGYAEPILRCFHKRESAEFCVIGIELARKNSPLEQDRKAVQGGFLGTDRHRRAARIKRRYLKVEARPAGRKLGDQLWLEAAIPIPRDGGSSPNSPLRVLGLRVLPPRLAADSSLS